MATEDENSLEQYSEETFDFLCKVCKKRDNRECEAQKFCSDCHEYFCMTCVKFHDFVQTLSSHNIVDKGQNISGLGSVFPAVPTEKCGKHIPQPIVMYCKDHDVMGCNTCIVSEHRMCHDIAYIPDFVKSNPQATDSKDIEMKLELLLQNLQEIQNSFVQEKVSLLGRKTEEMKKIQDFRKEINKRLNYLEGKSVENLNRMCQTVTDKIESAMKCIQDVTARVKSAEDNLKSAGSNMSQLFVNIKRANQMASTTEQEISSSNIEFNAASITFVPDQRLMSLLNDIEDLAQDSFLNPDKKEVRTNTEAIIVLGQDSVLNPDKKEVGTNTETIIVLGQGSVLNPNKKEVGTNTEAKIVLGQDSVLKPDKKEVGTNTEAIIVLGQGSVLNPDKKEVGTNTEAIIVLRQGSVLNPDKKEVGTNTEAILVLGQDSVFKPDKKEVGNNTEIIQQTMVNSSLAYQLQTTGKEKTAEAVKSRTNKLFVNMNKGNQVASSTKQEISTTNREFNAESINFAPDQRRMSLLNDMTDTAQDLVIKPEKRSFGTNKKAIVLGHDSVLKPETKEVGTNPEKILLGHYSVLKSEKKEVGTNTETIRELDVITHFNAFFKEKESMWTAQQKSDAIFEPEIYIKQMQPPDTPRDIWKVTSICRLNDGTILLTETYGPIGKLKRLQRSTLAVHDYCDVSKNPQDVCAISYEEAAVCFPSHIQLVLIGNTMSVTKDIQIRSIMCTSLTHSNGILYYSDGKSINEYTREGHSITKSLTDQTVLRNIKSIVFSNDGSRVYVADQEKGLIILGRNGQVIKQYNGKQLGGAVSLCYYDSNILVAGYLSDNVVEFSPDGELIRILGKLKSTCKRICCNQDYTKLIICYIMENKIDVINLRYFIQEM